MRVTWLAAGERILFLRGAPLSLMNVYLDEIPWKGPDIGVPLAVLMAIAPLEEASPPRRLSLRILSEDGATVGETEGQLPAAAPGRAGKAIVEGFVSVDRPGRYLLEIVLDGVPLDDAPTWRLDFVSTK